MRYSEIASRIDAEAWADVIGFETKYRKNSKNGEELVGHCLDPWGQHQNGDTTGKLAINPETRLFNCWVCGGGTILSYTMAIKDMDEQDAINWLTQFAVDQTDETFLNEIERLLHVEKGKKAALPYFNENVLTKWEVPDPDYFAYLDSRGISERVGEEFRLGYDAAHTRRSSKGDHTSPAIIFPHFWNGRLVGWQERWLGNRPKHIPKYTNTHDFPREGTIYGYEHVYLARSPIVVCESVPTVLFLRSLDIPAVATFGASVTGDQIKLLRGCHQGVVIAPDQDKAGVAFAERLLGLERYVPLYLLSPPDDLEEGQDLGDLVGRESDVKDLYQSALPVT